MKKLISIFMFILMLNLITAQEAPIPMPVVGHLTINGISPNGYHIQITNLDFPGADIISSDNLDSLVTERGTFAFDLSYFGYENGFPKYEKAGRRYAGDRVQVQVVKDPNGNTFICSQCVYIFNIPQSFPYQFNMDIVDSSVTIIEKTIIKTEPERESNLEEYLLALIAGILVMFGWGKGFAGLIRYYLNKAKEEEKKGNKELAQRYRERAKKMAQSVITGFLAGKYK